MSCTARVNARLGQGTDTDAGVAEDAAEHRRLLAQWHHDEHLLGIVEVVERDAVGPSSWATETSTAQG